MGPLPLIAAKHQSAGPENELPQWQQKIALRAKNPSGPKYVKVEAYFLHEVQFSAAIEAAHFPDPQINALQQSREGAPFMGTALAACKQSY